MEKVLDLIRKIKSTLGVDESRIKKKLILYFILISVVSISTTLEVILEVSETHFQDKMADSFLKELENKNAVSPDFDATTIDHEVAFEPLRDLRVRMLLLLSVIVINIITALTLFAKDIANPIDALVEGAKKVADGDLTYTLQVHTEDEIGQLAKLINDMNANLQELVVEIRFEMTRLAKAVDTMQSNLQPAIEADIVSDAQQNQKIRLSEINKLQKSARQVNENLQELKDDLAALSMLIDMYKVYQVNTTNQEQEV